jgi:hypothetical protein
MQRRGALPLKGAAGGGSRRSCDSFVTGMRPTAWSLVESTTAIQIDIFFFICSSSDEIRCNILFFSFACLLACLQGEWSHCLLDHRPSVSSMVKVFVSSRSCQSYSDRSKWCDNDGGVFFEIVNEIRTLSEQQRHSGQLRGIFRQTLSLRITEISKFIQILQEDPNAETEW